MNLTLRDSSYLLPGGIRYEPGAVEGEWCHRAPGEAPRVPLTKCQGYCFTASKKWKDQDWNFYFIWVFFFKRRRCRGESGESRSVLEKRTLTFLSLLPSASACGRSDFSQRRMQTRSHWSDNELDTVDAPRWISNEWWTSISHRTGQR